ncbi:biotin carboxylase [Desulfosporosinus sp. Tol-M]|nr:biotin carboxylase [Desulfosporosinus sp. Tol-M]
MILGASRLQVPAIQEAKRRGLFVIAVDYDKNAEGFSVADKCIDISTIDCEGVYKAALENKPDYIITSTSDMPVRTVAYVREKLNMPLDISYTDSFCATNKAFMRQRFRECGIPIPRFNVIEEEDEFKTLYPTYGDRFIIKPADNAASRGVRLVDIDKGTDPLECYKFSFGRSRTGTVLIEEYMLGPEVSVESFTLNGITDVIAITDKIVTQPPFFVELGHTEQSQLSENIKRQIKDVVKRTLSAVGVINGPSHTELKITTEGPKVVETAARLGGDFITSKLVPLSTGIDMTVCSISLAVGEHVDLTRKYDRGSAIRFIPTTFGIIAGIDNIKNAKKMFGVTEIELYKKIGDRIGGTESSNDRIGHVIATGKDANQAAAICDAAMKTISVEIVSEQ